VQSTTLSHISLRQTEPRILPSHVHEVALPFKYYCHNSVWRNMPYRSMYMQMCSGEWVDRCLNHS